MGTISVTVTLPQKNDNVIQYLEQEGSLSKKYSDMVQYRLQREKTPPLFALLRLQGTLYVYDTDYEDLEVFNKDGHGWIPF